MQDNYLASMISYYVWKEHFSYTDVDEFKNSKAIV